MAQPLSPETYCREIEAYLCRKNDGHLVRISGPAFERVMRWATDGVPFTVACAGIDRCYERYHRKGPRRRPLRVEFCEADVLDAFDQWRRAVGVTATEERAARPRHSLSSHVERVSAQVTSLLVSSQVARPLAPVLERLATELETLSPGLKAARGPARDAVLGQLAALDRELVAAMLAASGGALLAAAQDDAKTELAPFRDRMTAEAYAHACAAATERHLRQHFGLPTVTFS